jgi:hypothetical protein
MYESTFVSRQTIGWHINHPFNVRGNMENSRRHFSVDTFFMHHKQPALTVLHKKLLSPSRLDCNFENDTASFPNATQFMSDK